MFRDVLVPCRVGKYYLFSRRVLSLNITPIMVQGILINYQGYSIQIKKNIIINLKDFSTQSQIGAIKKIVAAIGRYDEVVTSLSSSVVAFKEIQLPFLGRDKLEMIVAYEVESLLPFSVEESVVDFMITAENHDKKISTVLVAAARKEDIDNHYALFEKADISLSVITIDLFALYDLYFWGIYNKNNSLPVDKSSSVMTSQVSLGLLLPLSHNHKIKNYIDRVTGFFRRKKDEKKEIEKSAPIELKHKQVELLVDVGFDVIRILYMQDGLLRAVRVIPFGVADIAQAISKETGMAYYDIARDLALLQELNVADEIVLRELKKIFEEVAQTLSFFEKQEGLVYVQPQKIWFAGLCCNITKFIEEARMFFGNSAHLVNVKGVLTHLHIKEQGQEKLTLGAFFNLSLGLFTHYDQNINFLKSFARKVDTSLLNKQLLALVCMTVLCIGGVTWRSVTVLQEWQSSYDVSKKQLIKTITQRMNIDLKSEKNLKTIVEKTEEAFKKEKTLWFSFSRKNERSILEYLQDLSEHIDRASIGLDLLNMHIDYDKVTLTGTVKSLEAVEVFEEELMELKFFTLVEKPREVSFTVQLKVKESAEGSL